MSQDTSSDPNENYDKFIEIVLSTKEKHLPTKKKKFNRRKHRIQQDAREAMCVVFFCTYKTYLYAQNEISYIKLHKFANCNSANYDV